MLTTYKKFEKPNRARTWLVLMRYGTMKDVTAGSAFRDSPLALAHVTLTVVDWWSGGGCWAGGGGGVDMKAGAQTTEVTVEVWQQQK